MPSKLPENKKPAGPEYGKGHKLIGKDYTTNDLFAKVTGRSKYAEDFRAEGMLFCKLLLSPSPHCRVRNIDASEALAMPGVKGILTADDLPAAEAIEKIKLDLEYLPFAIDPLETLRPGSPNARIGGNVWYHPPAPP